MIENIHVSMNRSSYAGGRTYETTRMWWHGGYGIQQTVKIPVVGVTIFSMAIYLPHRKTVGQILLGSLDRCLCTSFADISSSRLFDALQGVINDALVIITSPSL